MGVIDDQGRPVIDPARNQKTPQQGAATTVWAATSPQLNGRGGVYCENCDIAVAIDGNEATPRDFSVAFGVLPWATDLETADRLWRLSETLIGRHFDVAK